MKFKYCPKCGSMELNDLYVERDCPTCGYFGKAIEGAMDDLNALKRKISKNPIIIKRPISIEKGAKGSIVENAINERKEQQKEEEKFNIIEDFKTNYQELTQQNQIENESENNNENMEQENAILNTKQIVDEITNKDENSTQTSDSTSRITNQSIIIERNEEKKEEMTPETIQKMKEKLRKMKGINTKDFEIL